MSVIRRCQACGKRLEHCPCGCDLWVDVDRHDGTDGSFCEDGDEAHFNNHDPGDALAGLAREYGTLTE